MQRIEFAADGIEEPAVEKLTAQLNYANKTVANYMDLTNELEGEVDRLRYLLDECHVDVGRNEKFIASDRRCIKALNGTIKMLRDCNGTLDRMLSARGVRLDRVQDVIDVPRGRSFQAIVERISDIIREDEL